MRALFAYQEPVPLGQADAEVFVSTMAALSRRGWTAQLAVPRNGRGHADLERSVRDFYHVEGTFEIVEVGRPQSVQAIRHLQHALALPTLAEFGNADFVYTRNLLILAVALLRGQRVVFDHYRLWGDQKRWLKPGLRRLMNHPSFLGLVVHSRYARAGYEELGVPSERVRVIHNGFNPTPLAPRLSQATARDALGLPEDRHIAVYAGRIDVDKGVGVLLEMARKSPDTLYLLVGSKREGPIEREAQSLENVRVLPWQPLRRTAEYLYAADVLLIPPSQLPLERYKKTVLPLKVFLYLAAARPILAGDTADIADVLENGANACLVPPDDVSAAVETLARLRIDTDLVRRLSAGAATTAEGLSWDARAERIDRFVRERLNAV